MVKICNEENQLEIIIDNLIKIEEISGEWNLSKEERKDLYTQCSEILNSKNYLYNLSSITYYRKGPFVTTLAYTKLFEKDSEE